MRGLMEVISQKAYSSWAKEQSKAAFDKTKTAQNVAAVAQN